MTIVYAPCGCKDRWDKIGMKKQTWTELGQEMSAIYGGFHYFTKENKAAKKWLELYSMDPELWYRKIPHYWAVHLNGKHIVNVKNV